MKARILILVMMLMSVFVTGCYWNEEVPADQVAVKLNKGQITEVAIKPGGVYTDSDWWADLQTMNIGTVTFSVEDPEVLTKDNQAVGVKITIQARRKSDPESVSNIFTRWSSIRDDQNLINTISATAREGIKNGTRTYTLTTLLDDRNGLAGDISSALKADVEKYSVEIVNVTVENIAASPEYMLILSETANLTAKTEQEKRRQELINQEAANRILEQQKRVEVANAQVLAEQAETTVQVEIAERQGEIIAASNQVYAENEQAFELQRIRELQKVFNDKTVFFVQEGVDPTLFFNQPSNTTVIPAE